MKFGKFLIVVLGVLLLVPVAASAQSQFAGNVTDDTGGALPGVTVTAASEALIEGSRLAVTDGSGQYQIINLRPGNYVLTYDLPGFGTQVRNDVTLPSDVTITLDVVLAVGSLEESITVSGETPVVDVQQTERVEVLTAEVLQAIPTGGSLYSFGTLVPGVRTSLPDIGGARAMEQVLMYGNGSGGMDTTTLVDGMQVNSSIGNGAYQMYFNPQMMSETSFTTSGAGADTKLGGIRVNMVPKDGGNQFSGTGYFGGSHRSWNSDVWNSRLGDLGVQSTNQGDARDGAPSIDRVFDMNASLGGPIVKDKLWFFGSIRNWGTDNVVLNSFYRDGVTKGLDDGLLTSGLMRLTYQANSKNKFSAYLDRIRKVRNHEHNPGDDIQTASSKRRPLLYYTAATKWTSTLTNRMLAEFGFSMNGEVYPIGYQPEVEQTLPTGLVGCFTTPCFPAVGSAQHLTQTGGGDPWYGGPQGVWTGKLDQRLGYSGRGYGSAARGSTVNSPFKQNIIGSLSYVTGSHNVKVGFEQSWSWEKTARNSNANLVQIYGDEANPFGNTADFITASFPQAQQNLADNLPVGLTGAPQEVRIYNDPATRHNTLPYEFGFYLQDSWTIDRLTINYGGRFDIAKTEVMGGASPQGRFVPSTLFGAGGIELLDIPKWGPDFSPRFSLAYDLRGDGRTALKLGMNRYPNAYGLSSLANIFQPRQRAQENRLWNDIALDPATGLLPAGCDRFAPAGCGNPYGTNGDNIAQDWEIGATSNSGFGIRNVNAPSVDLHRGYNDLFTVGIQQEVRPGLSVSAEFRRRWVRDPQKSDNLLRNFSDFNGGTPIFYTMPAPYVGTAPIYNINESSAALVDELVDNLVDAGGDYRNRYTGFELSFQGRLQGGGTVFGGWSMDSPGTSWFSGGGVTDNCGLVREEQDDPNQLRFCDGFAYPTPYRHEFKISGSYPLPWWDLRAAGTFLSNAGGYAGDQFRETQQLTRASTTYGAPFYTADNCTGNCVLGSPIVPTANGGVTPDRVGTSTSAIGDYVLLPGNSVKFPPYWTQLDASVAKTFDFGRVRWEVMVQGFNLMNVGFEQNYRSSRSTAAGRQSSVAEYANQIFNGRIMRLSTTARW
jgi:hypothetical protein